MSEDKMREDYNNFMLDFESDNDRKPKGHEIWKSATEACAAIKDAEIAELKKIPMKYKRMEFNAQLQNEIASRDLMIKELRETIQQMLDAQRLSTKYAPDNVEEAEKQLDRIKKAGNSAREALANSEHHNSKVLDKKLLEARIEEVKKFELGLISNVQEYKTFLALKLAKLNKG